VDTSASKPANKPEVVVLQRSGGHDELAAFLASFPGETRGVAHWRARLRAWWSENPACPDDLDVCWLLRDAGRIAGFMGAIPARFQLDGVETIALGGTTWRVLPEYRGSSLALKTRQMKTQKDFLHISTTPLPKIAELLRLLGYVPVGKFQDAHEQSMVVLDYAGLLRQKLGGIAALLAAPFAKAYGASQLRRLRAAGGFEVRKLARADAAFDELWARTKGRYANTSVRDAASVNWYCFASPAVEKTLLGCYSAQRLTGFMILMPEEKAGMRILTCLDLWLDPAEDERRITAALIAKAAQLAQQAGLERVLLPHFNKHTAEILRSLPLFTRPAWEKREFLYAPKEMLAKITPENSFFTGALGDHGL
jgi:hypothetical protein